MNVFWGIVLILAGMASVVFDIEYYTKKKEFDNHFFFGIGGMLFICGLALLANKCG